MPRKRRNVSCDISIQQECGAGSRSESPTQAPPQRNAANARERARMRVLSKAFCRLKTTLPWVPADTKLSKLDTLRLATSYIAHLKAALTTDHQDDLAEHINGSHPLNLTWPFTFQHCSGLSHHTVPVCRPRGDSDCSGLSPISDVGATCMDHTDDGRNGGQEFEEFMYNDNYTNSGWHHHHR